MSGNDELCIVISGFEWIWCIQYLQDRAALLGKPSKGKAIAPKKVPAKAKAKANDSSDYDSDSEDISESEGSDNLKWNHSEK